MVLFDPQHSETENTGPLSLLLSCPLFRGWGLVVVNLAVIYLQKDSICPTNSFLQKEHYPGTIYEGFRPQNQLGDGTLILGPQEPCGATDFQGHVTNSPEPFVYTNPQPTYRGRFWLPGMRLWDNGSSLLLTCSHSVWVPLTLLVLAPRHCSELLLVSMPMQLQSLLLNWA